MSVETLDPAVEALCASVTDADVRAFRLARKCDQLERDLTEAKARLADIANGATMFLQPACNLTGAMRGYVMEVKRVASAPL